MKRRDFLKFSVLGTGVFGLVTMTLEEDVFAKPVDIHAQVRINPDNSVVITVGKLEMGQGSSNGLAMLIADELNVSWDQVHIELGKANPIFIDPKIGMQVTGGSHSIANQWDSYRLLGASICDLMKQAASKKWQINKSLLFARDGYVYFGNQQLPYSELAESATYLKPDPNVALKYRAHNHLIGKQVARLDTKGKAIGETEFGIDYRLGSVAVALIARPPAFGAKLVRWSIPQNLDIGGVLCIAELEIDRQQRGIVVIASRFWVAKTVRDHLNIEWDYSESLSLDSNKLTNAFQNTHSLKHGDSQTEGRRLEMVWNFPYLAHTPMEPLNCTVELNESSCKIWVGTQFQTVDLQAAASLLNFPLESVELNTLPAGGAFGRRATASSDTVCDAIRVAQVARSKNISQPIKLIWTREDETQAGYFRPMHSHRAMVVLGPNGKVESWQHSIVGQSLLQDTPFEKYLPETGIDGASTEGISDTEYLLNKEVEVHHPRLPIPVLWWRSVGHNHTAHVVETMLDVIATETKTNPIELRLKYLPNTSKSSGVLKHIIAKHPELRCKFSDWPAGYGVAVHKSFGTAVGYVVKLELKQRQITISSVNAYIDCGLVINKSYATAQVEGAICMAISTLYRANHMEIKNGKVITNNFDKIQISRTYDIPPITVEFIDGTSSPTGMGEPPFPPFTAAVCNAVRHLKRIYPNTDLLTPYFDFGPIQLI